MSYDKETSSRATLDPNSLGNLVLREGLLTPKEFQNIFEEFASQSVNELLGQFLVRKGILCEEKLELLLIRQEAQENGGVEDIHVQRAMRIAERTGSQVSDCINDLVDTTEGMLKVAGG